MLGTLEKPSFSNKFVRPCAWSFVEEIRERIGIPWGRDTSGLNLAFPLVQGFYNKGANEISPCAHCGMMPGSLKHRKMMEGTEEALHIQFTRYCDYSGDPLGRYRCLWCHDFNEREERLPSREEVEERIAWYLLRGKLKWSREAPESGYEFRCAQCGASDGPDNQLFVERSGRIVCYGLCALKANIEEKKELYKNRMDDPEYRKRVTEEWKEWHKKKMEDSKARSAYTERRRELYRKLMEDPEKRKKCNEKGLKRHKKRMENPDARKRYNEKKVEIRKRKMQEPGARDLHNEKRRARYKKNREDPVKRKIDNEKKAESRRKRAADPEKRKKDNERRRERRKEDEEARSIDKQKKREQYNKQMEDPEARKRMNEMAAANKRKRRAELKEKKKANMDEEKA